MLTMLTACNQQSVFCNAVSLLLACNQLYVHILIFTGGILLGTNYQVYFHFIMSLYVFILLYTHGYSSSLCSIASSVQ